MLDTYIIEANIKETIKHRVCWSRDYSTAAVISQGCVLYMASEMSEWRMILT